MRLTPPGWLRRRPVVGIAGSVLLHLLVLASLVLVGLPSSVHTTRAGGPLFVELPPADEPAQRGMPGAPPAAAPVARADRPTPPRTAPPRPVSPPPPPPRGPPAGPPGGPRARPPPGAPGGGARPRPGRRRGWGRRARRDRGGA